MGLSYLFISDSAGSSWLWGFSLVAVSGGDSLVVCKGFSLWWLLLLWSAGSRLLGASVVAVCGLGSCGSWGLLQRLSSSGPWA